MNALSKFLAKPLALLLLGVLLFAPLSGAFAQPPITATSSGAMSADEAAQPVTEEWRGPFASQTGAQRFAQECIANGAIQATPDTQPRTNGYYYVFVVWP